MALLPRNIRAQNLLQNLSERYKFPPVEAPRPWVPRFFQFRSIQHKKRPLGSMHRRIQRPPHLGIAKLILGGLVTSTALNLFLLPALYARFGRSAR